MPDTTPSRIYAVSARIIVTRDKVWSSAIEMPTFYLMADVQGIMSEEGAADIARSMFVKLGHDPKNVHVCAVETSMNAHSARLIKLPSNPLHTETN